MTQHITRWRRFSLRGFLFLTFTTAVFFAGYRVRFHAGRDALFDRLIELIESTVAPETWENVGGPGTVRPFEGNCCVLVVESAETSQNPFATGENPFQ